jgi:hypothetical protein
MTKGNKPPWGGEKDPPSGFTNWDPARDGGPTIGPKMPPGMRVAGLGGGSTMQPGGIRVPPGGTVSFEVSGEDAGAAMMAFAGADLPPGIEVDREIVDQRDGSGIRVSSALKPDPMAIYFLALALRDCTETVVAITTAQIKRIADYDAAAAKHHRRAAWLSMGIMAVCGGLLVVTGLGLTRAVWGWP